MKIKSGYRLVMLLLLGTFTACEQMDATFDEYVVPGGITYTGKASAPVVHVGRNRVKISWPRGTDPTVTKARIFWNNYSDSVEVAIPPTGSTISTIIDDLPEQTYAFVIKTYDAQGNSSVPVELLTATYGEKFQERLLNRPLNSAIVNDQGQVTLAWGAADISGGAYATEVSYTGKDGTVQLLRFPVSEASSTIPAVKAGTALHYKTIYLPAPLSIDTFATSTQEHSQFMFDKSTWSIASYSTQHNTAAENVVKNIIDGSAATRWHTLSNASAKYPHFVVVDMKADKMITGFEIFRMAGDVRACDRFQLLVSNDNKAWLDLGSFDFDRMNDGGQFYPIPGQPKARYFKFVGLSGPNGYMVMGEINVYGL